MTETVLSWPTLMDAIAAELAAVTDTNGNLAFTVIQGEPIGLPLGGPYACFWYLGRTVADQGPQTLTNVMYAARVQVLCLWPVQAERGTLAQWEADIATVDTSIRRRLRANSTVNSNVTDLDILDSDVAYGDLPVGTAGPQRALYRVLQMELRLDNLEGEAISA